MLPPFPPFRERERLLLLLFRERDLDLDRDRLTLRERDLDFDLLTLQNRDRDLDRLTLRDRDRDRLEPGLRLQAPLFLTPYEHRERERERDAILFYIHSNIFLIFFLSDLSCQCNIFWHYSDSFGVNCAQIRVLKQAN